MATPSKIDQLPGYVDDDGCRFFLNICKDTNGKWSAAYLCYNEDCADGEWQHGLMAMNEGETLDEVAIRLQVRLERRGLL